MDWAHAELGVRGGGLYVPIISGDSMTGTIDPGDKVLVNVDDRIPGPPGVSLVHNGLGLVAKRASVFLTASRPEQRAAPNNEPPRIRLNSTNPDYPERELTLNEAHILGRILAKWDRIS